MSSEYYTYEKKVYVASESIQDATLRAEQEDAHESAFAAWMALDSWERQERSEDYEVYEMITVVRARRVNPPYSA